MGKKESTGDENRQPARREKSGNGGVGGSPKGVTRSIDKQISEFPIEDVQGWEDKTKSRKPVTEAQTKSDSAHPYNAILKNRNTKMQHRIEQN